MSFPFYLGQACMQVVYFGETPGTDGGVGENEAGKEGKPTQRCVMELGSSLRVRGAPSYWDLPRSCVGYASGPSTQETMYPLNRREDGNIYLLTSISHRSEDILWAIHFLAHPGYTRMSTRQVLLDEPCQKGQRRSLAWISRGKGLSVYTCGKLASMDDTRGPTHAQFWAQTSGGFLGPGIPEAMQKVFYHWGGLLA